MMLAIASELAWLCARNDAMLPGELFWEAVCSAPIMPPELSALWMADCASDSQFDEVLETIDGIDAMVDSSVLPAVLATPWLVDVEDEDAEGEVSVDDELPRKELG